MCFHSFDIVVEGIFGKEVALGRFARGVTNHAGGATDKGHRLVAAALKVAEYHHTAQVADMQRVGSRVKADVGCDLFSLFSSSSVPGIMSWSMPRHLSSSTKFIDLNLFCCDFELQNYSLSM